jgi:hydrogenase maturation protease
MLEQRREALVLGIGNVLWADEGFGVRAVELLHARYAFPAAVELIDGGTLGLNLLDYVVTSRRVLVLDAIDFGLTPGTLRVLRDADVPAWGHRKLSPHQTGFNDVLALAQLQGRAPESIVAIGVQPVDLHDFGGSLSDEVKARLESAVALAAQELASWGFAGVRRAPGDAFAPLHAHSLSLAAYEDERPSADAACRVGDARVLARLRGMEP